MGWDYPDTGNREQGTGGWKVSGQERHCCFLLLNEHPGFFVTVCAYGFICLSPQLECRLLEGLDSVSPTPNTGI